MPIVLAVENQFGATIRAGHQAVRETQMKKTSKSKVLQFPERLRRARTGLGLTQQDLASSVKVAQADLASWEKGRSAPTIHQFLDLEAVVGPLAEATGVLVEGGAGPNRVGTSGTGLKRARAKSKLSTPARATKANTPQVARQNVASDGTAKPHAASKKKRVDAAPRKAPTPVVIKRKPEQPVESLGRLTKFAPHSQDDLPICGGIYVLYDISDRAVYVGQGQSIKKRVLDHAKKPWFQSPIVETAAYIQVEEVKLRLHLEEILIRFLKSNAVLNKQHVNR